MADESGDQVPAGEEPLPADPGPAPAEDAPPESAALEGELAAALDEVVGALDSVTDEGLPGGGGPDAAQPQADDLPPEFTDREDEGDHLAMEPESGTAHPGMPADAQPGSPLGGQPSRNDDVMSSAGVEEPSFPNFPDGAYSGAANDISMLGDVDLKVHIELGRTLMYVEDVLKLSEGSVVELENLAGDPVAVFVNDRLIARGEVLVLNDNFCVRVSEIVSDTEHAAVG